MILIGSGPGLLWQLITVTAYRKEKENGSSEKKKRNKAFALKNSPSHKSASVLQLKGPHGLWRLSLLNSKGRIKESRPEGSAEAKGTPESSAPPAARQPKGCRTVQGHTGARRVSLSETSPLVNSSSGPIYGSGARRQSHNYTPTLYIMVLKLYIHPK